VGKPMGCGAVRIVCQFLLTLLNGLDKIILKVKKPRNQEIREAI
jgi:hypothetical protein